MCVNDGHVETSGAEAQLVYRPDESTLYSFQYSYADASGRIIKLIEGDQPVRYNERINEGTPNHTLSLLTSRVFSDGIQASLAYFYLSDITWGGDGDSLPSYSRWDAKITKSLAAVGDLAGKIGLLVQNLLDDEYTEFRDDNIYYRRVYLQLSLQL